jgi:hypothetical protein
MNLGTVAVLPAVKFVTTISSNDTADRSVSANDRRLDVVKRRRESRRE